MGHLQCQTPIHCNNSTAIGIANNTVKQQRSCSMEMRFFEAADAVAQGKFGIKYHPGKENLGDNQSMHHIGAHHTAVHHWYLHEPTSVNGLPHASKPSTLKGCVGTLPDGYVQTNPLPQVSTKQSVLTSRIPLPPYFGLPILIPMICRMMGPAIGRARIPWWFHS